MPREFPMFEGMFELQDTLAISGTWGTTFIGSCIRTPPGYLGPCKRRSLGTSGEGSMG